MTCRGGGRGSGRRGSFGRIAGRQLGRGHVLIEVVIFIKRIVLFQSAPPGAGRGVLRLRVLGLKKAGKHASKHVREEKEYSSVV